MQLIFGNVGRFSFLLAMLSSVLLLAPILESQDGALEILVFRLLFTGVYVAAVYRFATADEAPQGFDADMLRQAFKPKG